MTNYVTSIALGFPSSAPPRFISAKTKIASDISPTAMLSVRE
jgi:hypothetical protein